MCTLRTVRTVHKGPGSNGCVEVRTEVPEYCVQITDSTRVQYVQYAQYIKVLAQMAGWRSVQRYLNIVYKLQTVHVYSTYNTEGSWLRWLGGGPYRGT
jgi:hypothetical protein